MRSFAPFCEAVTIAFGKFALSPAPAGAALRLRPSYDKSRVAARFSQTTESTRGRSHARRHRLPCLRQKVQNQRRSLRPQAALPMWGSLPRAGGKDQDRRGASMPTDETVTLPPPATQTFDDLPNLAPPDPCRRRPITRPGMPSGHQPRAPQELSGRRQFFQKIRR